MRKAILSLALVATLVPAAHAADVETDLALFSTSVSPNVVILMDNSGSMDNAVWHPNFDPTATSPGCAVFNNNSSYVIGASTSGGWYTFCGRTRWLYNDPAATGQTLWLGRYLNWYFDPAHDTEANEILTGTATRVCDGTTFLKYQRSRITAAKQVVMDTICELDASRDVRVGLAIFRDGADPHGGYLRVGADDPSTTQFTALENAVSATDADTWTPLGESLFQIYTYFMTRDSTKSPVGQNGTTAFPLYRYSTSTSGNGGQYLSSMSSVIPSPVQYECQKNFVVIITDGEPTMDDFDTDGTNEDLGFGQFAQLIGDYNADGEVETGYASEGALYLDDIAKFMATNDFDTTLAGDQLIDVYTIGFTTSGAANALLAKTAAQGNGIFFTSNSAEELTVAITSAITNILEKTQSFTAATVPSARTTDGGSFFTSFFLPSAKRALWEGHVRAFTIDAAGNILDSLGNCALDDPDGGGECNSGPFFPSALEWWDAAAQVPAAGSRKLYTSKVVSGNATRVDFSSALTAADLGIQAFAVPPASAPNPIYPGSVALNEEGLADEVVSYARGCNFATGVSGADVSATVACAGRTPMLGDIFHSAPLVVSRPRVLWPDASYLAFKSTYATRDRMLYVGANDGFLHAVHAGSWQAGATPPSYDAGTGGEKFGFMPWYARKNIKNLYVDRPDDRTHYVDGSPQAADVWIHPTATTASKNLSGSEWKTVLVGAMRGGGPVTYALDVTNPASGSYPGYMWEFPKETDPDNAAVATSFLPFVGETWGQPIITRVRVNVAANTNGSAGYERWVAVVTGGYDTTGDPNDPVNYDPNGTKGRSISIIDVKTGEVLASKRYDPTASDAAKDMLYAIPSTPSVLDIDADGFADVIYVGDLGGQVFKWVVSPVGEDRVNDGSPASDYSQPNWDFSVFFQAPTTFDGSTGTTYYKSFYFPPAAAKLGSSLWLSFGSGERKNLNFPGIPGLDENNRFYVAKDADPENTLGVAAPVVETDLTDVSGSSACASLSTPGYFFTLPDGEKFVTRTDIFAGLVFVASYVPPVTTDPCNQIGNAAIYIFSLACGEGYFVDGSGNADRKLDLDVAMPTDPQVSVGPDGKDNRIYIELSNAELMSIGMPDVDGAVTSLYWRMLD